MVAREINTKPIFFLKYLIKVQHNDCTAAVALRIVWKKTIRNIKKDRLTGKYRPNVENDNKKPAKITNSLLLKEKSLQKNGMVMN